jgi:LacI family transcriptional regulator
MNGESSAKSITIFDVAREAGVSYSTVSRVVNNFPRVNPETRARVQAAMEKLGYVANLQARSLAGGRSGMLGLLVYDLESSYMTELVRGVDAEFNAGNHPPATAERINLCNTLGAGLG